MTVESGYTSTVVQLINDLDTLRHTFVPTVETQLEIPR